MADIVNLNKARKAKLQQEKVQKAKHNRILHGIPAKFRKAEKERQAREADRLDGHTLKSRYDLKKD